VYDKIRTEVYNNNGGNSNSVVRIGPCNIMKCNFCNNPKYVERINNKGVLENFCVECITSLVAKNKGGKH
jgi:predicted nucleic acid-binding Zn finger protein